MVRSPVHPLNECVLKSLRLPSLRAPLMKRGPGLLDTPALSLVSTKPGLITPYPAAAACSMVCVHVAVSEGVTVISLPEKLMSSVSVLY